jgi:hypothetical protein
MPLADLLLTRAEENAKRVRVYSLRTSAGDTDPGRENGLVSYPGEVRNLELALRALFRFGETQLDTAGGIAQQGLNVAWMEEVERVYNLLFRITRALKLPQKNAKRHKKLVVYSRSVRRKRLERHRKKRPHKPVEGEISDPFRDL